MQTDKTPVQTEALEALETLRKLAPSGSTVYTILRHVSGSGMSRRISVVVISENRPRDITLLIDRLGLFKADRNKEGLKVGGAGMDMGFHVVYSLSSVIHEDGYALRQSWL